MKYSKTVKLKNGKDCMIRNATYEDGPEVYALFDQTHGETDYLLSYPGENSFDVNGESEFLQKKEESDNEIMLLAVLDNKIVATAGIDAVGKKFKVKHRAEFGIDVAKDHGIYFQIFGCSGTGIHETGIITV